MSNLPQPELLEVEEKKITQYLLNLEHAQGGPKAVYFKNRGFELTEWELFAAALREHGATQPVTEVEETGHGRKYTVECSIATPDGKNPCILSVWIAKGDRPPRLVTAHPNS